jgi:endonuclease/exonuclease/phosphatase family metal-dependent hydrolase
MTQLKLVTFNVLAPCWADPLIYPVSSEPFLERIRRRAVIINLLKTLAATHDVIALQETQIDELPYFDTELKRRGFEGFAAYHRDDYWSQYITQNPPFASNGVALYWNKAKLTKQNIKAYDLGTEGNRGIVGDFKVNNQLVRISCIHLDSDTGGRRAKEAKALINILGENAVVGRVDFILGDLNFNYDTGPLNNIFYHNGFQSLLKLANKEEPTHPFTKAYQSNDNYGIIDHILVRKGSKSVQVVLTDTEVITHNVWTDGQTEEERINLLLQRNGSDHFAVRAGLKF